MKWAFDHSGGWHWLCWGRGIPTSWERFVFCQGLPPLCPLCCRLWYVVWKHHLRVITLGDSTWFLGKAHDYSGIVTLEVLTPLTALGIAFWRDRRLRSLCEVGSNPSMILVRIPCRCIIVCPKCSLLILNLCGSKTTRCNIVVCPKKVPVFGFMPVFVPAWRWIICYLWHLCLFWMIGCFVSLDILFYV